MTGRGTIIHCFLQKKKKKDPMLIKSNDQAAALKIE